MKLFKKHITVFLILLSTITLVAQTNESSIIDLDSIIINKNPNLILNHKLNSKDLSKKGIDFTVKYHDNRDETRYSLFDIPVKSIEIIIANNELISLELNLEEGNERIENVEKLLIKYLGDFNAELSEKKGSQRNIYFGETDSGFLLDAFLITENNMGHLSVGYITEKYKVLDKKMRQNN